VGDGLSCGESTGCPLGSTERAAQETVVCWFSGETKPIKGKSNSYMLTSIEKKEENGQPLKIRKGLRTYQGRQTNVTTAQKNEESRRKTFFICQKRKIVQTKALANKTGDEKIRPSNVKERVVSEGGKNLDKKKNGILWCAVTIVKKRRRGFEVRSRTNQKMSPHLRQCVARRTAESGKKKGIK